MLPIIMISASYALKADDNDDAQDHVRAFDALREGKIVPLTTILDWLAENYVGYVVEIELEINSQSLEYEVEFVTEQGEFLEFYFDAATGALIRTNGDGAEAARKRQ